MSGAHKNCFAVRTTKTRNMKNVGSTYKERPGYCDIKHNLYITKPGRTRITPKVLSAHVHAGPKLERTRLRRSVFTNGTLIDC